MAITDKTRKQLWGSSGNRCAKCRDQLSAGTTQCDSDAVVGDECHIAAVSASGPRYDPTLPPESVDSYDNLILLCKSCHKIVDEQRHTYTVERLRELKRQHTAYVRDATQPLRATSSPGVVVGPAGPDTIEKRTGVLWSHVANIPEEIEVYRFRGQLLAELRTEGAAGPTWYELYRLRDGRFVVYTEHVERMDYCEAYLHGVNAGGELDPPLSLKRLQKAFPSLATKAGLARVIDFEPEAADS